MKKISIKENVITELLEKLIIEWRIAELSKEKLKDKIEQYYIDKEENYETRSKKYI